MSNLRPKISRESEAELDSLNEHQQRIVEELGKLPYQGYNRLGKNLGLGRRRLQSLLNKNTDHSSLREQGLVNKTVHGWTLTNQGLEYYQQLQGNKVNNIKKPNSIYESKVD